MILFYSETIETYAYKQQTQIHASYFYLIILIFILTCSE